MIDEGSGGGSDDLIARLRSLESEALEELRSSQSADALEAVRVRFLGRKEGLLSLLLRGLGSLPDADKPLVGAEANRIKVLLGNEIQDCGARLTSSEESVASPIDLTLPGRHRWVGGIHPITRVMREIEDIFRGLGFTRARGPEAETEWHNFEALNTPLDHPAADVQDTLYLSPGVVLRSHTSPVQIRTMQSHEPPIRILAPGWVYRRDSYDATHTPAFSQIEGLVVDEGITFVDLKATLEEFSRRFWGPDTRVRFRPSFFPFTEPSAEVDVKRVVRRPDGSLEEGPWLEIMGAGMVDPAVLENVGYDPERYSGFAFGMGPGRIAMLKYGVTDLRHFFENDIRTLRQFTVPPS